MKSLNLRLVGLLAGMSGGLLSAQGLVNPVLSTPGTASWTSETIGSGSRTVFTLNGNTILNWSNLKLGSGSELVFDFVGGEKVVNVLGGFGAHRIDGSVISNGHVSFFSPHADLLVNGSITAKSVTLATLDVNPADVLGGGGYTMGGSEGWNELVVSGRIHATQGDVVIAGNFTEIQQDAGLKATGAVRLAGGAEFSITEDGSSRRIKQSGGGGFVLHLGQSKASTIEVVAGDQIVNQGLLDSGRIFLEVGEGGRISNEGTGVIISDPESNIGVDAGTALGLNEGDAAAVLSSSALKMPALKRPDGSKVNSSRTVVNHAPMTASADTGRDRRKGREVASNERGSKPMMQRASFFGMRGGSPVSKSH